MQYPKNLSRKGIAKRTMIVTVIAMLIGGLIGVCVGFVIGKHITTNSCECNLNLDEEVK